MCAKFLRAYSLYLNTAQLKWPYTNSASAISNINNAAADLLEGSGAVAAANREAALRSALQGIVGRWKDNGGVVEQEFIERADVALSKE